MSSRWAAVLVESVLFFDARLHLSFLMDGRAPQVALASRGPAVVAAILVASLPNENFE